MNSSDGRNRHASMRSVPVIAKGFAVNRWFLVILIILAVIVLVSPGIVGRLAEKSVEENLEFATSESDHIIVTTESFQRGWFTSEGRHRIALRAGALSSLLGGDLVVDTHIDHGLVPVTSMARDAGSLKPGLASTVSTVRIDRGSGELIELPGKIYSIVGLTGETVSRYILQSGSRSLDDGQATWQGADVTVTTNPETGLVAADGSVSPWSVQRQGDGEEPHSIRVDTITLSGNHRKSLYGIIVGSMKLEVGELRVENPNGPPVGFEKLSLDANSQLDGDKIHAESKLDLIGISQPALGNLGISMEVVVSGADAQSLQKITTAMQDTRSASAPQQALAEIYPLIEADLQKLLASGLELRFDRLDVSLPNGELTSKFRINLPASEPGAEFSWPALLLTLDASADLRLPVALFEMLQLSTPDAGMLVAMGVLKPNDGYYEMRAEYAKGLITVNGAPMPIPLQGL